MGVFAEMVTAKAEKNFPSPAAWLRENVENLKRYRVVTHVGKYTHPDVQTVVCDESQKQCDGYLTTAAVGAAKDVVVDGGAAYMGLASILVKKMENGRTVLQNFEDDTQLIRDDVMSIGVDYEELRQKVLQLERPKTVTKTDSMLRQVYFPVESREYHLLSLMSSSANMKVLTDAIVEQNARRKECRDKKSEIYGADYEDTKDLTRVNFGGAQPQNISGFNGKGGMYLLASVPPLPPKKKIRLPQKEVFYELPWSQRRKETFEKLDKLFKNDRNNKDIRHAITKYVQDIAYNIIFYVSRIRETSAGWSEKTSLSLAEKTWLDNALREKRNKDTEWTKEISESFGRWFIKSYEKMVKDPVTFSDTEMHQFAGLMQELLVEEVRNRK